MEDKKSYFAIIPANVRYDERLSSSEKLLYGEITALCNEKGYCWATNGYFADLYKVTKQSVSGWISHLEKYGYIQVEFKEEGIQKNLNRYIKIFEYPHQKNFNTPLKKNLNHNNTRNNNKNNNIYIDEFSELWKIYPRKIGKEKALKSYISARNKGTTFEEVKKGVEKYKKIVESTETKYIKHGSTWFNEKSWQDEYELRKSSKSAAYDLDLFEKMLSEKE